MQPAADSRGCGTPKQIRIYVGKLSERGLRNWYHLGLRHIRLPNGTILIAYSAVDEFLQKYEVSENAIDKVVDDVMSELT